MNQALIELLWDYMKRDSEHKDRVRTGWGTKTKQGLVACIENAVHEYDAEQEMEKLVNTGVWHE